MEKVVRMNIPQCERVVSPPHIREQAEGICHGHLLPQHSTETRRRALEEMICSRPEQIVQTAGCLDNSAKL